MSCVAQRGLEDVVGPDHVHPHRAHRALEDRVDAGDGRRSGRACVAPCASLREELGVEDVALDEAEVRMVHERRATERVAVQVVDRDDLVLVDEAPRERRADEARAARHDDALSRQSHAGESTSRPLSGRWPRTTKTVTTSCHAAPTPHPSSARRPRTSRDARRPSRRAERATAPRAAVARGRSAPRAARGSGARGSA